MGGLPSRERRRHEPKPPKKNQPKWRRKERKSSADVDGSSNTVQDDLRRQTTPPEWKPKPINVYVNEPAPALPKPRSDKGSKQGNKVVRAVYDYQSRYNDDCSFKKGDRLVVVEGSEDDWWWAKNTRTQDSGYIPSNYVVIDDDRIESQDWWYAVDRSSAVKQLLLPGNPIGTFLIRNSTGNSAYALSVLDRNPDQDQLIPRHFLIRKMDDGVSVYISARTIFKSLQELVTFYSKPENKERGGMGVLLTIPCPREVLPIPFKELEVKQSDIVLGSKLGAGQFGEVYAGKFRNVVDVAVKTLKVGSMDPEAFIDEAKIMHQLRHRKLVQLLGVCSSNPLYIITERMVNGSLLDYLRKDVKRTIKLPTLIDMAAQVADGMSYLESKNFIHRDLRAANILAGDNFVVKVADFGLARMLDAIYDGDDVYTMKPDAKFPIRWTAPEAFMSENKQGSFSIKSDVWSFGILLFEIVTYGRNPYPEYDNRTVMAKLSDGYRMPSPNGSPLQSNGQCECPPWLYDLMMECWRLKPEERPTFESLKYRLDDVPTSADGSYAEQLN